MGATTEMKTAFGASRYLLVALVACTALAVSAARTQAQIVNQAIGGVSVNAEGVVDVPSVEDEAALGQLRENALAAVPKNLEAWADLRAVSLKQIEAEIAQCIAEGKELPEAVRYLGGLQRVEYVFVYPEQNDVVLAGPAEGWRVDALGNVVGATTGRPVVLLEDLIVALRTRDVATTRSDLVLDRSHARGHAAVPSRVQQLARDGQS